MFTICSRIVVPYDNSPLSKKALETAISMAKQDERIEVNVVSVIQVAIPVTYYITLNIEEQREAQRKAAQEVLNDVEKHLKDLPNKSRTFILEGNPAEMIVDFVRQNDADLVVMGSRGLSGLKEMFLGSVSHNVVQKCPCPVFILK